MAGHMEVPTMNWSAKNVIEAFKLRKQKMGIYFSITVKKDENQIPFILKGCEDEGLRRYNTFKLSEEDKKKPDVLWSRFEEQLKISRPNFRAARLDLHYMYQKKEETLNGFIT